MSKWQGLHAAEKTVAASCLLPPSPCHSCPPAPHRPRLWQEFYSLTLDSMAESKNERLWFKTNMKLANLWVGLKEGGKAAKASHLHLWCREGLGSGCRGRKQRPVFPDHRKDGIAWSCCCTSQRRCVACVHTPDSQCRLLVALVCPLAAGAARAAPLLPDGGWAGRPEEGHAGGAGAGREALS